MSGQDGYATDPLTYDTNSDTFMAGVNVKPGESLSLGLGLTWSSSQAGLHQFDLSAPDYVATHPTTAYDFSESHTYSDLDTTRIDWDVHGKYKFTDDFWMFLRYRLADFDDDAPYMYDTTGSVYFVTAALGWAF